MTKEGPLRALLVLAALFSVPSFSTAQESQETKKKDDLTKVETDEERREGLDQKLDSTLSEFDALMLREQEILESRREAEAVAGGGGGAGKAEAGGGEAGAEGTESEASGEGEPGGGEAEEAGESSRTSSHGTGGSPDEPAGEPIESGGTPGEETSESESGQISNGRIPPDVGTGEDDDIVARQLREAAMKEEDPELRERLWDEYRAYKFGEKKKETGEKSEGS
jgi:hypothetical protein